MADEFWLGHELWDAMQLLTLISSSLLVILLIIPSGLGSIIWMSYRHSRHISISDYVKRFMPLWSFSALITLLHAIASTGIVLHGLKSWGYLDCAVGGKVLWSLIALIAICYLSYRLILRLSFGVWQYLLGHQADFERLAQDYLVLYLLWGILKVGLLILTFTEINTSLFLWLVTSLWGLFHGLRLVQGIRRWADAWHHTIGIFLYLCGHELLPLGYVFVFSSRYLEGYL